MPPPRSALIDVGRLPRFPAALSRVLRHVHDRDVSPDLLQKLLITEPAFQESLVRAAGLASLGGGPGVRRVDQAIARLGREGFEDLVFTLASIGLFRQEVPALSSDDLRRHSLATALIARDLSRTLHLSEPALAYRAGLVHDIGFIALASGPREAFARAVKEAARCGGPIQNVEEAMLGIDHTYAGFLYGEALDLPREILAAIRYHHQPSLAPTPRALSSLVSLADHFARLAGLGYGFEEKLGSREDLRLHPAWLSLCDERPSLLAADPQALALQAAERLGRVESLGELCGETVLAAQA